MTLPFDRKRTEGFTILEALIAFALLAMVLAAALPALSSAAIRQSGRLNALLAAEFAVSVLEEYRVTFPHMASSGDDPSGWQWRIAEAKTAPDGPTSLDSAMDLVELRLTIWHHDRSKDTFDFTTLVARPKR